MVAPGKLVVPTYQLQRLKQQVVVPSVLSPQVTLVLLLLLPVIITTVLAIVLGMTLTHWPKYRPRHPMPPPPRRELPLALRRRLLLVLWLRPPLKLTPTPRGRTTTDVSTTRLVETGTTATMLTRNVASDAQHLLRDASAASLG